MSDWEDDPFADWPSRTPLYDDGGRLLLVSSLTSTARDGLPWADGAWRPAGVSVGEAAAAALDAFAGWAFSTSDELLASALVDAGATRLRHAHVMSHDLRHVLDVPPTPGLLTESLDAEGVARHAERLGRLRLAAYPESHPDHSHITAEAAIDAMTAASRGEVLGPIMPVSKAAWREDAIVGACLVVDREGSPPDGGPWILDIFRDATSPVAGVGRSLLVAVLLDARDRRLPAVSLAVSHDNARAVELYVALGFRDASQSWTLALPAP